MGRPPLDQRVNAIGRRALTFTPRAMIVHERGAPAGGPQLVAGFNRRRISVWVKAPKLNSAVVYLGDAAVTGELSTPVTGGWLYGPGWDLEPGESIIITDTMGPIFAVAQVGQGDQLIKWLELSDPGPEEQ